MKTRREKLKALIDHPSTPRYEREAAQRALDKIDFKPPGWSQGTFVEWHQYWGLGEKPAAVYRPFKRKYGETRR